MKSKTLFVFLIMVIILIGSVNAAELSMQLKRTNPGIAGETSAELIFNIVNEENNKIEAFIMCRSQDGASFTLLREIEGSGEQYVSNKFIIDKNTKLTPISILVDSDMTGDRRIDCTLKYVIYRDETIDDTGEVTKIIVKKEYKNRNNEWVSTLTDDEIEIIYRKTSVSKTVPFVDASADAIISCPPDKVKCYEEDVIIYEDENNSPAGIIVGGGIIAVIGIIFYMRRKKKND